MITHAKDHLERREVAQKASQTFFGNTLVQQNIVKSINKCFLYFE